MDKTRTQQNLSHLVCVGDVNKPLCGVTQDESVDGSGWYVSSTDDVRWQPCGAIACNLSTRRTWQYQQPELAQYTSESYIDTLPSMSPGVKVRQNALECSSRAKQYWQKCSVAQKSTFPVQNAHSMYYTVMCAAIYCWYHDTVCACLLCNGQWIHCIWC